MPTASNKQSLNNSLQTFIASQEMNSLVLKGDWGVGKTHAWQTFIDELLADKNHDIHKKFIAYSYVSLFGVASIADVKREIFNDATSLLQAKELMEDYQQQKKSSYFLGLASKVLTKDGGLLKHAKKLFPDYDHIFADVENMLINRFVVCIDDLERKNRNLKTDQIMGLIDELVNQKKCKVILIFNEKEMNNQGEGNIYTAYREKLIDLEVLHNPSLSTVFDIHFKGVDPLMYRTVYAMAQQLDIKNIRILGKIKWLVEAFWPDIKIASSAIKTEFLNNATFLCWAYFKQSSPQEFDQYCQSLAGTSLYSTVSLADITDQQSNEYRQTIRDLGVSHTLFDNYIIEYLGQGYTQGLAEMSAKIKQREDDLLLAEVQDKLKKVWGLYSDSFADNLTEFQTQLEELLQQHPDKLYLNDFDAMLTYLDPSKHPGFIKQYIQANAQQLEPEELAGHLSSIKNEALVAALQSLIKNNQHMTIDEAITGYKARSWSMAAIEFLSAQTVEDIVDWMKSEPDELVAKIRSGWLRFGNNKEPKFVAITNKAIAALQIIAAESTYNASRVKNIYGISLPPEDQA